MGGWVAPWWEPPAKRIHQVIDESPDRSPFSFPCSLPNYVESFLHTMVESRERPGISEKIYGGSLTAVHGKGMGFKVRKPKVKSLLVWQSKLGAHLPYSQLPFPKHFLAWEKSRSLRTSVGGTELFIPKWLKETWSAQVVVLHMYKAAQNGVKFTVWSCYHF